MPEVTITERDVSGEAEDSANGYVTLLFNASGSDDYNDVVAALGVIPSVYNNLVRQGITREPLGGGHWILRARYAAVSQPEPPLQYGDPERITWQSVSTTVRRTHAELIAAFAPPGGDVPNNGEALNVTEDGVEGTDVDYATGRMTITQVITSGQASTAYGKLLAKYCRLKAVNDAEWRGFAAGEVRFIDFEMSSRGDGYWDLTRIFDVDENVTGGTFAGVTGISKKAHEYMWALTQRTEDATAKRVVEETVCVSVHRVYPEIDFTLLEP